MGRHLRPRARGRKRSAPAELRHPAACSAPSPSTRRRRARESPEIRPGTHDAPSAGQGDTPMKRTLALAAAALVQSVMVFVTSSPCLAQEEGAKSLFMPSVARATMESMADGLLPLTFYIAFQVAVMT